MYGLASLYENTSTASRARSRQQWLILFSLDRNHAHRGRAHRGTKCLCECSLPHRTVCQLPYRGLPHSQPAGPHFFPFAALIRCTEFARHHARRGHACDRSRRSPRPRLLPSFRGGDALGSFPLISSRGVAIVPLHAQSPDRN